MFDIHPYLPKVWEMKQIYQKKENTEKSHRTMASYSGNGYEYTYLHIYCIRGSVRMHSYSYLNRYIVPIRLDSAQGIYWVRKPNACKR